MPKIDKTTLEALLAARFEHDEIKSISQIPHPNSLKGMEDATRVIASAMEEQKSILIIGDYDVDGTMSTYILMEFFRKIGYKNVSYKIPNRLHHGYGISVKLLEELDCKIDLIITVDNGTSAFEAAQYCHEMGIRLVITDHHMPQLKLPICDALINPKQPGCTFVEKEICGAMIAWYLANGIKIKLKKEISLGDLLTHVMLATISDIMPLKSINRAVVRHGLKIFNKSKTLQNALLKSVAKIDSVRASDISFFVSPLINSAGRMDDANLIVEFMLSEDRDEIQRIFKELSRLNETRKQKVDEILNDDEATIMENDHCIIMYGQDWTEGVLGIVASNLTRTYRKNAFVLNLKDGILKGSGRSDGKSDIFKPLMGNAQHSSEKVASDCIDSGDCSPTDDNIFLTFGGHPQAVGLSLRIENLSKLLCNFTDTPPLLEKIEDDPVLGEIELLEVQNILDILDYYEPFGKCNPTPLFHITGKISQSKVIKNVHQRLFFENKAGKPIGGIEFFADEFCEQGDVIRFEAEIKRDHFNKNTPNLIIRKILS